MQDTSPNIKCCYCGFELQLISHTPGYGSADSWRDEYRYHCPKCMAKYFVGTRGGSRSEDKRSERPSVLESR